MNPWVMRSSSQVLQELEAACAVGDASLCVSSRQNTSQGPATGSDLS